MRLIEDTEELLGQVCSGVCRSRLSLSEILAGSTTLSDYGVNTVSSLIEDNIELFEIGEDTLSVIKRFESEGAYMSAAECDNMVNAFCAEALGRLKVCRQSQKSRASSMHTVINAYSLIMIILMV